MKKIYVKYKILLNGLYSENEYEIDGFILKRACFDKKYFDMNYEKGKDFVQLNMNVYLYSCVGDYETLEYCFFESCDFSEFNVLDETIINKTSFKDVLQKYKITEKVDDLEMKLRLVLNIPLLFQAVNIEFYDENKKYISSVQSNRTISFWNRLSYGLDKNEIYNNSRLHFDLNVMKSMDNNQFHRALYFYNHSFDSDIISNRFILIFSSLESIFNLDATDIKKKLAKYSAKLLCEDNKDEYRKIYNDIKELYKKRCEFVHGEKNNNILYSDEKRLRRYVRKIIIAYWYIALFTKKTAKQILKYLDSDEKLDIQVRMMIVTLNSDDFSSQQHRLLDLLEKDYQIVIPEKTKENLLSNCK